MKEGGAACLGVNITRVDDRPNLFSFISSALPVSQKKNVSYFCLLSQPRD
jgi:hypothetical protein